MIMSHEFTSLLWVVVRVQSGIPVDVEVYTREQDALRREREWRLEMNLNNDETGVFPVHPIESLQLALQTEA